MKESRKDIIFFGIGFGTVQPSCMAIIADVSPRRYRGFIVGVLITAFQIGYAIGPTSMGLIAEVTDLSIMFVACGICLGLGTLVVFILLRKE